MSKHSVNDVADILDNEGVGYAIECYMNGDSIEDPELAKLWDEAARAIKAVTSYVNTHLTEDSDSEG